MGKKRKGDVFLDDKCLSGFSSSHSWFHPGKRCPLRNHQDQVMYVLAVETWLPWKDTFQRREDRLDLWIIYWKRIERSSSSVIWDITTGTTCMGQKESGRRLNGKGEQSVLVHFEWLREHRTPEKPNCWSWQDPWSGVRLRSIQSSGTKFRVWESSNVQRRGWDLLLGHISVP